MKTFYKITLALAVMLISVSSLAQQTEAKANLNVLLGNAYNIEINSVQSDVSILMNQTDHFINGNSSQQDDHIQVTATGGYAVTVQASAPNFVPETGASTIGVDNIYLVPQLGSLLVGNPNAGQNVNITPGFLNGTTGFEILNVEAGERKRGFHMEYKIPTSKTDNFLNKEADTYTTVVTYTLIPNEA